MTESEHKEFEQKSLCPKFDRWVLADSWSAFLANLPIISVVYVGLIIVTVLRTYFDSSLISGRGMDLSWLTTLISYLYDIPLAVLSIFMISILMYVVHSTILGGKSSWDALLLEKKKNVKKFSKRFLLMFLAVFGLTMLIQIVVLLMIFALGSKPPAIKLMVTLGAICSLVVCVVVALSVTWPASAVWCEDKTWNRALLRGRKSFWYLVSRHFFILPVFLVMAGILFAVVLPILISKVGNGGVPVELNLGVRLWGSFLFSLFGGVVFIFWIVAQTVIISRALLIGEARLPAVETYE
ncbi:hypothetical protein J4E05_19355 [Thalassospira sp. NFXS8]|uniref:hypothetical protein n=1 Tax=Thalassospira sp. NFXS8 TaxID=2819093 RepID=UPI0032DFDE9A